MKFISLLATAAVTLGSASAQEPSRGSVASVPVTTAIPVTFTRTIDANHAHLGDAVTAETTQVVRLENGRNISRGARVMGHVVTTAPFNFDHTPYAKQQPSALAIHFDSITDHGQVIPISVYVRAMADPITSWSAADPSTPDSTFVAQTQIGGDQLVPSQSEVLSRDGDVVAYQRKGGVYAHLIASQGNSPDGCDSTDTEQSVKMFSASACGLYGFVDVSLTDSGRRNSSGTFVLQSRRGTPTIWKHSNALLEVIPATTSVASR